MMERHRGGDRDRDRDYRDRDRDRDRNFHHQHRRPSRFSDAFAVETRRSPVNYRGGFSDGRRAFESSPQQPPVGGNGGFIPPVGGPPAGFWPAGSEVGGPGGGRGFGNDFPGPPRPLQPSPSLSGQKRGFPFSGRGGSPEHFDGKSFVKLFVGSVPRTATEEEIRPLFEEQGNVLEVALIKDKRTGQQQGCCFIKYATSEEADRAIRALHNQYTLPGGVAPIQVRYADGERERLGAVEYKLFVGSLNKLATVKEVEEIFARYGRIEDVYLMRDERKQSRGCGFVKFSNRESAMAAINDLNGIHIMRGCDQPLIVRFADPKRPRAGEPRSGPALGGPGFGPSQPPGIRPGTGPDFPGPMDGLGPPNAWQSMNPQNLAPSANVGLDGFSNQFPPRSGDATIPSIPGAHVGGQGNPTEGSVSGAVSATLPSSQNFNQPFPQMPSTGHHISPLSKPVQSLQYYPPPLQLHQGHGTHSQAPTSQAPIRPFNSQVSVQGPYSQPVPSQQIHGSTGHVPSAVSHVQQNTVTATSLQKQPNAASPSTDSQQNTVTATSAPQKSLPYQQSPSQITQMLSQQRQSLQASFLSSKQAFSQLQQQAQMMHPSVQNQAVPQSFQASRQQWATAAPSTATSVPALGASSETTSTSSAPVGSAAAVRPAPVKCNWTEHTSPDGYKYYYNYVTGESRWLKPEELESYEQQQNLAAQPPNQPSLQAFHSQQVSQTQPPQLQTQFHHTRQLQNLPLSSMYQTPGGVSNSTAQGTNYSQLQAPMNSANDSTRFQQVPQAAQDWAWKNNSGGN